MQPHPLQHQAPSATRIIALETPDYIVRTLEPADATDEWRDWMTDAETMHNLNAAPQHLSVQQVQTYIASFNGSTAHLLGIFERNARRLVGIRSIYVDPERSEFFVNVLVGDPQARNKGARSQSRAAVYRYFFEDLDLRTARATILARNEAVIAGMPKRGWIREHTDRKPAASGEGTIELYHYRLPREVWRQKELEREQAQIS